MRPLSWNSAGAAGLVNGSKSASHTVEATQAEYHRGIQQKLERRCNLPCHGIDMRHSEPPGIELGGDLACLSGFPYPTAVLAKRSGKDTLFRATDYNEGNNGEAVVALNPDDHGRHPTFNLVGVVSIVQMGVHIREKRNKGRCHRNRNR